MSNKWKIATSGRLGKEFAEYIDSNFKPEKIHAFYIEKPDLTDLSEYNAYAGFNPPPADISKLEWIHCFGAGVDGYTSRKDLSHATRLTRSSGSMGRKIAEYCLNHILSDNLNRIELKTNQIRHEWRRTSQRYLQDTTVIILGTGTIGTAISILLRTLNIKTVGVNRSGSTSKSFDLVIPMNKVEEATCKADFLINALPWSGTTDNLLNIEFFSQFKGIHYINIGRGKTARDNTVIEALDRGYLRHATLDVVEIEPLPASSTLWDRPDVTITPHQAALTELTDVTESFNRILNNKAKELEVDIKKGY